MSWVEIKTLSEQRATLVEQAGDILKRAKSEDRDLSPEENQEFEQRHADADKLLTRINTLQRQATAEGTLEKRIGREDVQSVETREEQPTEEIRQRAFNKFLRWGGNALDAVERRAMGVGETGAGAEIVPDSFYNKLITVVNDTSSVLEVQPLVLRTSDGRTYPIPVLSDTVIGERIGENEMVDVDGSSNTEPQTDQLPLGAFIYSSRVVKLSKSLVEDSAFDIEGAVSTLLGQRVAAKINYDFTLGDGTGEPQGCVTGASLGVTGSSSTAVTYTEMLDLIHSCPRPYRSGAKFMLNDSTLLAVRKLVDGDGNLLFHHGNPAAGMADTIAGHQYVVNVDMPNLGASNKAILFGNFAESFAVRFVRDVELYVFREKYLDYLQIGYLAALRADCGVFNNSALKYFVCKA